MSGWQVAGDANLAGEVYPDQILYPANSAPALVKRINSAFRRADQIAWSEDHVSDAIAPFQEELGAMGYAFHFITLGGFQALNAAMFELANGYESEGMSAYVSLQEREFAMEQKGYTATRHELEVGAGYFDLVAQVISGASPSTLALEGSTESDHFYQSVQN